MPALADARRVRVGICAWADPALIEDGSFYPRRSMTPEARLRFYASVFDTVEVNASYYAIPDPRIVQQWIARTPPDFVFHVKAYALMTGHHGRLRSLPAEVQRVLPARPRLTRRGEIDAAAVPEEAVALVFRLFAAAIAPLREAGKLGYVLFQLAPWVRCTDAALDRVRSLPRRLPGCRIAVEFRDRSWYGDRTTETLGALRDAGISHVAVDGPPGLAVPRVAVATAPTAVLRLHGRHGEGWLRQLRGEEPAVREKYDYLYREEELRALLPEVEALAAETEEVDISFNNNNRNFPVVNALMMKRLLGQPAAGPAGQGSLPLSGPA